MISLEEIRLIPVLHKQIERDKAQLRYLEEKATAVPSTLTGEEKVQTSPTNNQGKYIDAATDLNKEIESKQNELTHLQKDAKIFIGTVDDRFARKVLKLRYMKCYTWGEIADLLGYEVSYLRKIEREITYKLGL